MFRETRGWDEARDYCYNVECETKRTSVRYTVNDSGGAGDAPDFLYPGYGINPSCR